MLLRIFLDSTPDSPSGTNLDRLIYIVGTWTLLEVVPASFAAWLTVILLVLFNGVWVLGIVLIPLPYLASFLKLIRLLR